MSPKRILRALRTRRPRLALVALAVLLGTVGLGTYAAISAADESEQAPVEALQAEPAGKGRFARAYGMTVAEGSEVFTLANGAKISVAKTASAECLFAAKGESTGETCDSNAAIDQGKAIAVTDECGTSGEHRMEITGLAPAEAAKARLNISDSTTESTSVQGGAFRFEGTNPGEASPYPISVTWLRANNSEVTTAALPVEGDEFCPAAA